MVVGGQANERIDSGEPEQPVLQVTVMIGI